MELDFEQLVNSYYELLYRFALTLARNEADACDLTQDTFYTFASKGHQLRDKSKIKSWLFTSLHRKFLGARRHETRFPHFEVSSVEQNLPTISPTMIDKMDGATVWEALMQLEENYRAPLVLLYLEEHSYREIADTLEIPIGTVMSRISRGKALLRESLTSKASGVARKIVPLEKSQLRRTSPHD
ncbi:MAG: RNA polymerase sigma factor [Limisphaerales bacterium]